jgi:hypothetical protein
MGVEVKMTGQARPSWSMEERIGVGEDSARPGLNRNWQPGPCGAERIDRSLTPWYRGMRADCDGETLAAEVVQPH